MKDKGKRFLVCCIAFGLVLFAGSYNFSNAAYREPGHYDNPITEKQTYSKGIDSYSFININSPGSNTGGALWYFPSITGHGGYTISNSLFSGNSAGNGGAIYADGDVIKITNSKFSANSAEYLGGAIRIASGLMNEIRDSLFEGNIAGTRGGAIHVLSRDYMVMQIFDTDFINNIAGQNGGAMYIALDLNNGHIDFISSDGTVHKISGNVQGYNINNDPDWWMSETSNGLFIEKGEVNLKTQGNDSKWVIDDIIEGSSKWDMDNAKLNISSSKTTNKDGVVVTGGSITLNNQVKNLILTHQSGTLLLTGDKISNGASILQDVDLFISPDNSGADLKFNLANGKIDKLLIRNLSITKPTGEQKLLIALDVNLKEGISDYFEVTQAMSGNIAFNSDYFEFNILEDGDADKFQLFNRDFPFSENGEVIQYTDLAKYVFTIGEDGYINVTKEDTSGLPEAVASDEAIRNYIATKNIKLTQSLNAMGGESLTIDMKNFNLDGNKNQGITLAADQRLEIKNAGSIKGGALSNFYTDSNGAVVNNIGGTVTITDSTIANNTSDGKGGAIYALGGAVVLNADTKDVILKNNVHEAAIPEINPDVPEAPGQPDITRVTTANDTQAAGSKNDIYLENASDGTKATLTVNGSKNTIVESGIAGNGDITKNDAGVLKLGGDNSKFTGDVYLNGGEVQLLSGATYFNAQNTHVKNNSRINLANNNPNDVVNFGNLNLDGTAKLGIDIDAKNSLNDKIGALSVTGDVKILIDNINIMSTTNGAVQFDVITLDEATNDSPLLGLVELSPEAKNVMSPIFKYQADFDSNTGVMSLSTGSRGNKNSYNPSILATPVALQAAAQAGIKEAVNYAFEHTDSFTKLPRNERFARVNADKYAISEFNGQLPLYNGQSEGSAFWFRPFTVFESIDLDRGPKVDNLSYGTLIGFDSRFKERRHGWTSLTSSFLGYHGSSLDYGNVDIMSNGALVGITKNYYKKNFWTALSMTGNVGIGEISEMYGDDNIVSLSGAVSSKTGYNMEFNEGKFIIQPNVSLSYYISKIFDYTNEAGVRINSDPLNAFEIKPGIRLIGNTEGGWQPYISAAFVWNTFNDTDVRANGIKLPEMSMDPYVEYGLGIQRVLNNDFTCYLQSLVRNGGRTGVSLTGGMSWAVGRVNRGRVHL